MLLRIINDASRSSNTFIGAKFDFKKIIIVWVNHRPFNFKYFILIDFNPLFCHLTSINYCNSLLANDDFFFKSHIMCSSMVMVSHAIQFPGIPSSSFSLYVWRIWPWRQKTRRGRCSYRLRTGFLFQSFRPMTPCGWVSCTDFPFKYLKGTKKSSSVHFVFYYFC